MRYVFSTCLLFLFCFFANTNAQQTISGVVTDANNAEALIGVDILIKGSNRGTITDFDGNYTLEVQSGDDTLVFSYIGYETRYIAIGARSIINVQMGEAAEMLDEIVVIGYGTIRKSDLTGSVYSVKSEELKKIPNANPLNALQGKVPGLQISNATGNPGESPVVRVRGVGTLLSNASPIYVVDGIILDDISFLNNDDIESIEVLKDASATAIYGSRGANGVIILTTKRGTVGKTIFNASAAYSVENVVNKIDVLDREEFAQLRNELRPGTYNNIDALPNTDWQDLIFNENAPIQKYALSVAGASDRLNYYLGGGFYKQDGVIDKSDYQRISLKANNSIKATDFLTLGTDLTFSSIDKTNPPGVVTAAYRAWPVDQPTDAEGKFIEVQKTGNPMASLFYSNNFTDRSRGVGNIYAEIDILKKFKFKSSYQADLEWTEGTSFTPAYFVSPLQQNEFNDLSKSKNKFNTWIWENTLNYSDEIDKHRFGVLLGYSSQETNNEFFSGYVEDILREDEDLWYINPTEEGSYTISNSKEEFAYSSILFRLNYTYNEKYLFTGTFRRDGSSKFEKDSRFGNFPSLAVGWRISEEPFMDFQDLSKLKLRASWGIIGNDKIGYKSRFERVQSGIQYGGVFGPDETLSNGATLTNLGNPKLQWEETETLDIGLEFGFFNDRISGEIDYYNKKTNGALVALLVPGHLGNGAFNRVVFNAADIKNSGIELNLTYRTKIYNQVDAQFTLIASKLKNEVLDLGAADEFISDGSLGNGQLVTRTERGESVGSFYGYKVIGVLQDEADVSASPILPGQEAGDLKYADVNGDGVISTEDQTYLGSYIPDYLLGMNMKFNYRNFTLSLDFQGQVGNDIYNGKKAVRPEIYNWETHVLDRWRPGIPSDTEPRINTSNNYNYLQSSYFVEDGSFLRLRNITLNYTLPSSLVSRFNIQNANLFLSGTNVFTLTEYSGYSPEIASNAVLSSGIDLGVYPITSIYTLGLNVTF